LFSVCPFEGHQKNVDVERKKRLFFLSGFLIANVQPFFGGYIHSQKLLLKIKTAKIKGFFWRLSIAKI
jgi:hypothetical protein